jgi:crotonobetainyl-CoA:carnitine CoA-transferase CaiB-like acyl-CoA transferase
MVMGPSCGLILADLGAEVIKIEQVGEGDSTRYLVGSGAGFHPTFNRNKKSLAINIKDPEGLKLLHQLVAGADAVTENFRPGVMERLGLGYEDLKAIKPDLIYCSMKGFMPGPYENRTALDEVVQMMGGLAYMTGPPGRPLRAGTSVNDIMGGMFGAIGIMAALRERDMTGKGAHVQSALFENNIFLVAQHMAQFAVTGKAADPMPNRISAWGIYDVFETSDDEQIFIGVVSDKQWPVFCKEFGAGELGADPSLATNNQRVLSRETLLPKIADIFRRYTKQQLIEKCESVGLPHAPITRPQDLYEDPHLNGSGGLLDLHLDKDGSLTRIPALPLAIDGKRPSVRQDLPKPGANSRELLEGLGLAAEDIDRLVTAGVVSEPEGQGHA